jgi:hypothetical protein
MGWWADWRLRRRLTLERREPRTLYEREWRIPEPPEEVLLGRTYKPALRHALRHVREYLLGAPLACDYCHAPVPDPRGREDITVRIGAVTLLRDPPPGGRDLHIVIAHGWAADIEHAPAEATCPRCGKRIALPGGRWGVASPAHGLARNRRWI